MYQTQRNSTTSDQRSTQFMIREKSLKRSQIHRRTPGSAWASLSLKLQDPHQSKWRPPYRWDRVVGVKVKEGKIKGRDTQQPEDTKLRGTQLPVTSNIVGGRSEPQQVKLIGGTNSEVGPPVIPESLHYSGD